MKTNSIGKRIRSFRESQKITQEQLAELCGLSLAYIGMIERGQKLPKLDTFIKIANVLKVSADMILLDELDVSYQLRSSQIAEKIEKLPKAERNKILDVIETMIS